MEPQRRAEVLSRGEIVGELIDAISDMWYLEGTFVPMETEAAARFVQTASTLNAQSVDRDPMKGIRAAVREQPDGESTVFLVLSLSDGRLFGRCVFARDAVEWALSHVPE